MASRHAAFIDDNPAAENTDTGSGSAHASILAILWRRRWLIASFVLVSLSLVTAYLVVAPPKYSATAMMEVATDDAILDPTVATSPAMLLSERRVATQMELLQSVPQVRAVVKQLNLVNDIEFNPPHRKSIRRVLGLVPGNADAGVDDVAAVKEAAVVALLGKNVSIGRIGQSNLLTITVTSTSPRKAMQLANAYAAIHLKRLTQQRTAGINGTITALDRQVAELRATAIDGERAAAAYGRSRSLIGSPAQASDPAAMDFLTNQLATARSSRAEASTRYASSDGAMGRAGAATTSPLLADLRGQQASLDKRLAELLAQFGPGYPEVASARAQRDALTVRLNEEETRVKTNLESDLKAAQAREAQLSGEVGAVRSNAMTARESGVGFGDLQGSAQTIRSQYFAQLARLHDLKARAGDVSIDISIATKAFMPTVPSEPQPIRLLAVALVAGLMLGCMAALLFDQLDSKVRTADQLNRLLGVETLGMVPELNAADRALPLQQHIGDNPTAEFAESLRAIYLELAGRSGVESPCIMVTSPLPGEGKTTLAIGLAAVAARLGARAVILDLDLRRPSLYKLLHRAAPAADLIDYFNGSATLDDITNADLGMTHLAAIGLTRLPVDPGSLVVPAVIAPLLDALRGRYDAIIITSPPVLPVHDARMLAGVVDATLLVTRWGQTTENAVKAAQGLMRGTISAAAINCVDYRRHAAAAYGDQLQHYGFYSSYFGSPTPAPRGWAAARAAMLKPFRTETRSRG